MKIGLLLLIPLLLISCNPNPSQNPYQKKLKGSWLFVNEVVIRKQGLNLPPDPDFGYQYGIGFSFLDNGICENKAGYYKRITRHNNNYLLYSGNTTTYKIVKDSLLIFEPDSKNFVETKIYKLTTDSLILKANNVLYKYSKPHINTDKNLFDEVAIASSGCYGSCAISKTLIKANGDLLYHGIDYNKVNGVYSANISRKEFENIEQQFANSNFLTLKNGYHSGWSDDETITLTFLKNNKIIKQISDYGGAAPAALRSAYTPLRYLYQQLKLKKVSNTSSAVDTLLNYELTFVDSKHKSYSIYGAEQFYLWSQLTQSAPTTKKLAPKFIAKDDTFFKKAPFKEVQTDGRIFKIIFKNGLSASYDLGYNYFDRNIQTDKFISNK